MADELQKISHLTHAAIKQHNRLLRSQVQESFADIIAATAKRGLSESILIYHLRDIALDVLDRSDRLADSRH